MVESDLQSQLGHLVPCRSESLSIWPPCYQVGFSLEPPSQIQGLVSTSSSHPGSGLSLAKALGPFRFHPLSCRETTQVATWLETAGTGPGREVTCHSLVTGTWNDSY